MVAPSISGGFASWAGADVFSKGRAGRRRRGRRHELGRPAWSDHPSSNVLHVLRGSGSLGLCRL